MVWRSFAPAKVNLYLHVGPARADGFHPLESVASFADVGDEVFAEPGPELSLTIEGPFAAALEGDPVENLALRAARVLRDAAGVRAGAKLTLVKRLPIASGIGGGSSDAAAALRACNALWGSPVESATLARLAGPLGSDVPVCLAARPALMTGLGGDTAPVSLCPLAVVLVNPAALAPTGAVYRAFDRAGGGASFRAEGAPDLSAPIPALMQRRNDLEAAAIEVAPSIREALEALAGLAGVRLVRMSGSGATCFGVFDDRPAAEEAARRLAAAHPRWWVVAAELGAAPIDPEEVDAVTVA